MVKRLMLMRVAVVLMMAMTVTVMTLVLVCCEIYMHFGGSLLVAQNRLSA